MPIRPELRKFYRGPAWKETRERILRRARNRCEGCRVPNRKKVFRNRGMWRFTYPGGTWHRENGKSTTFQPSTDRTVTIVLCLAHLNHVAGDDRDDNLKALCQWCHLNHDKPHHKQTRQTRKDASRPLLALLAS